MKYSTLAKTYEKLEKEPGKLKKTEILSELLKKTSTKLLPKVVLLASGKIFPTQSKEKTGIANKMMIKTLSKTTGLQEKEIIQKFKELGDLGIVAEKCIESKKQTLLLKKELTIELVFNNFQQLSQLTGKSSQERKMDLISQLLTSSKPKEAKYIVKTALGVMRIGVAEGIIRDSISQAYGIDKKIVENAWFLNPDYGEIAKIAKEKGEKEVKKVGLKIGRPYVVMLGESIPTLEEALKKYEDVIIEYKYDGIRIEIHKKGDKIWLFTRQLEDLTNQFPDLVELAKQGIKIKNCIVEGELVGVDPKTNQPIPFQQLSRRVQRKYDIKKMMKKIPIRIYLFDAVYADGKNLLNKTYKKRREKLEKMVKLIEGKFELSHGLVTKDLKEAEEFFERAVKEQEGVMVKNLQAKYQPGRRVGQWLKVKRTMEPLDLAIIGAEWGTGKRAKWLGTYVLACKNPETGKYLSCGMMGTGLTDEQFKQMTDRLKPLILKEKGISVEVKPEIIVEVEYEEIQKSSHYDSGYALRFPRMKRFRDDRSEPNEIVKVERLFKSQFKKSTV